MFWLWVQRHLAETRARESIEHYMRLLGQAEPRVSGLAVLRMCTLPTLPHVMVSVMYNIIYIA